MAEKQSNGNQKVSEQQVRREKLALLQEAGRDPFVQTKFTVTNFSTDITEHFDEMEGQIVTIAGRLMSKRGMGKVSFCDLQDKKGRVQLYVRRDLVGDDEYAWFKKYDTGDIVGVTGEVFKTEKGQISVRASKVTLLSKALQPLPEKFHGLTDHGDPLPPALCGSDRQPRGAGHLCQAQPDPAGAALLSGRQGLPRGGHPHSDSLRDRRIRPSLHHPPQHAGHGHVCCVLRPSSI